MNKPVKPSSAGKIRKPYSTPKLTTHGDARKLTRDHGKGRGALKGGGSNLFDGGGNDD